MLTTITTIAGFSVGSLIVLMTLGFAIYSRSFGKDSAFLLVIGVVMLGLATWQVVKPDYEDVAGYVPYNAPTSAGESSKEE